MSMSPDETLPRNDGDLAAPLRSGCVICCWMWTGVLTDGVIAVGRPGGRGRSIFSCSRRRRPGGAWRKAGKPGGDPFGTSCGRGRPPRPAEAGDLARDSRSGRQVRAVPGVCSSIWSAAPARSATWATILPICRCWALRGSGRLSGRRRGRGPGRGACRDQGDWRPWGGSRACRNDSETSRSLGPIARHPFCRRFASVGCMKCTRVSGASEIGAFHAPYCRPATQARL